MRFPKGYRWARLILFRHDCDDGCNFASVRFFKKFQICVTWQSETPNRMDYKALTFSWG